MLNLSTHQLNVFLVAAETLNFTQAAQRLQMTQPSVSQHILALEEHFGLPLFVRVGRNIELSDAGLALVPLARDLVTLSIHVEESMASLKGDIQGHLIIGCSTLSGRYLLPKLLADFHRQYPRVQVTCHVTSKAYAIQGVTEGKIHLALTNNPALASDLEFQKIAEERLVLIAPTSHPWAQKSEVSLSELLEADFILPDEGTETHLALGEALALAGLSIHQLQTLITLGSLEAIALSVQEGLGVGFVPEIIVNRLVKDQVAQILVNGLTILRDVVACSSSRRPATGAQDAFWEMICDPQNQTLQLLDDRAVAIL